MDQLSIDKYFQERYVGVNGGYEPKSCENIAFEAVHDIIHLFAAERDISIFKIENVLERVSVTIGAGTPASMTAEWATS